LDTHGCLKLSIALDRLVNIIFSILCTAILTLKNKPNVDEWKTILKILRGRIELILQAFPVFLLYLKAIYSWEAEFGAELALQPQDLF